MGRIGTHPATFVASSASSSPQMNTGKLYSSDSGKVVGSESLMGLRDNGGQSSNNPPSGAGAILVAIVALICAIILVLLGIIVYLCGRRGLAVWRSTGCIRPLTSGSDSSGVRQVATVGHSDGYLTAESIASAATVSDNLADRRLLRSPTGLITSESVYRELHPVHCCRQPCPITSFVLSPSEVESNGGQAAKLSYGYFTVPQTSLSQTSTSNNTTSTFLPTAFLPVTPIYRSLKEGTGEAAFEGTVGINDRSERSGSVQIRLNSPYNGLATKGIRNSLGCDVETVQNWQCPPISSFTAGRQESKETSDIAQHDYGPPCKSKSVTPGLQQKQSMLHGLYKGSAASLSEMDILQLIARINLDRNVLNKSLLLPETLADVKPTGEKEKANSKSDATNLDTYLKALSIQMLGNGRNTLPLVCNGHKQNRRLRTQEHKQVLATGTSVRRTQGGERTNGSLRSHAKVSISDSSGSRAATGSGAESADYSLSSFDVAGSEINCESELSHISQPLEQALKEARRLEILQDIKETWKNNQFLLNSSKNAKEQEQKHNWNFDLDFKRYGKQENIPLDGTNSKKRDDNIAVSRFSNNAAVNDSMISAELGLQDSLGNSCHQPECNGLELLPKAEFHILSSSSLSYQTNLYPDFERSNCLKTVAGQLNASQKPVEFNHGISVGSDRFHLICSPDNLSSGHCGPTANCHQPQPACSADKSSKNNALTYKGSTEEPKFDKALPITGNNNSSQHCYNHPCQQQHTHITHTKFLRPQSVSGGISTRLDSGKDDRFLAQPNAYTTLQPTIEFSGLSSGDFCEAEEGLKGTMAKGKSSPFYISAAWSANPSTPKRPLIDLPEVQTLSPGSLLLSPACVSFTTPATTCSNITGRHSTHSRPGQNTIQDTQPIDECSSSSAEQSDSSSTFTTDPYKNCFV